MRLSDRIARALAPVDPTPVSTALAQWDGKITDAAISRVMEVIEHDMRFDRKDGSGRLRPSSLSHPCARTKLLSYRGEIAEDFPRELQEIVRSGTWLHYYWQLRGLSAGIFTEIEVPFRYDPWLVSGSADARLPDGTPFEYKSMNSVRYKKTAGNRNDDGTLNPVLDPDYVFQIHVTMKAFGVKRMVVIHQERNFLGHHEYMVQWDDRVGDQLETQMLGLVAHAKAGTMPPILHGCMKQRGNIYSECRWKEPCFREG